MEKIELKETLELVKAVELLAVKAKIIIKDGIGAEDLAPAIELLKEINVILEGVKGADEAVGELKDLDQEELVSLGLALFAAYKKFKAA